MKKLLIILVTLLSISKVNAENKSCGDDCKQILEGVNKDQAQCLAQRDCKPLLKKKDAELKKKDAEIAALKQQPAKESHRKNRISLLVGRGPLEGLQREQNGTDVTVESKVGAIGGLQYQRLITDTIALGLQLQTNKTVLGSISKDF